MSAPDVVGLMDKEVAGRIKTFPVHTNRASSIGDPCTRKLVYDRVAWKYKPRHDIGLQRIFDEGNAQERSLLKAMIDSGIEISSIQGSFQDSEAGITGHMDLAIKIEGDDALYPTELKSCAPHIFQSLKSYPTNGGYMNAMRVLGKKYPWLLKYPAQIQMYLFFKGLEKGIVIFKNKSTGGLKQFNVEIDVPYIDALLKKSKQINLIVHNIEKDKVSPENILINNYLPKKIKEVEICEMCDFKHLCLPNVKFGQELKIVDDPIFEKLIDDYFDKKDCAGQYKKINERLNGLCRDVDNLIVGRYHVRGKATKNGWRKDIKPIDPDSNQPVLKLSENMY